MKRRAEIIPGIAAFTLLFGFCASIFGVCKFGKGFGIAGRYNLTFVDKEGISRVSESMLIKSDNTVIVTTYYRQKQQLLEPKARSLYWRLRFQTRSSIPPISGVLVSDWQFSLENSNGGSLYQLYYFQETNSFGTKTLQEDYDDCQVFYYKA